MAFLLCHVLANTSHVPTIPPTDAPNLRKTSRYILKRINMRRSPNPLQHKGLGDLTWHEWVRRKRIHDFLVRMRSAVRIRPAAPHKPCNHNGYRVLVLSANTGKMRFDYYLTTGAHHSAKKKRSALRFFIGYGNHLLCRWRHPIVPTTLNVSRQFLPSKQN